VGATRFEPPSILRDSNKTTNPSSGFGSSTPGLSAHPPTKRPRAGYAKIADPDGNETRLNPAYVTSARPLAVPRVDAASEPCRFARTDSRVTEKGVDLEGEIPDAWWL